MTYLLSAALIFALLQSPGEYSVSDNAVKNEYRFNQPARHITLPDILNEISGITWVGKNEIACIQDEKGEIFLFNLEKKSITKSVGFADGGDYEGIASSGNSFFVLRSDGKLYEITHADKTNIQVSTYRLEIPTKDNEGLCYDKTTNSLLIAAKSKPENLDDDKAKDTRFIYRFDLKTKKLDNKKFLVVKKQDIESLLKKRGNSRSHKNDKDDEDDDMQKITMELSDLAIDNKTGDIYLLSANDKLICIYSRSGNLKEVLQLDKNLYRQPEGIAFNPDGTVYISNEADGKQATIRVVTKSN